ncbi:unnamed protein product, partial [Urochloa humidicola]
GFLKRSCPFLAPPRFSHPSLEPACGHVDVFVLSSSSESQRCSIVFAYPSGPFNLIKAHDASSVVDLQSPHGKSSPSPVPTSKKRAAKKKGKPPPRSGGARRGSTLHSSAPLPDDRWAHQLTRSRCQLRGLEMPRHRYPGEGDAMGRGSQRGDRHRDPPPSSHFADPFNAMPGSSVQATRLRRRTRAELPPCAVQSE